MKNKRIPILLAVLSVLVAVLVFGIVTLATDTPSAEIKLHNLAYKQNVVVKYAVEVKNLPSDATVGVEVLRNGVKSEAKLDQIALIDGKEYYVFNAEDIPAAEMTSYLYAKPYIKKADGSVTYGAEKKNSILYYAYKILGKIKTANTYSDEVKELVSCMLDYGAAVQIYADKNVDRLANDEFYYVTVQGGKLSDGYTHGLFCKGETVSAVAAAGDGEVFEYWTDSTGAKVSMSETLEIIPTENESYTAHFSVDTSVVNYVLGGGSLPVGDWEDYTPGTAFTLPTPTKAGYVFSGWFTSSDFSVKNIVTEVPASANGEYTVYAKWNKIIASHGAADASKLKFNPGTDSTSTLTVSDGKMIWSQGSTTDSQLHLGMNLAAALGGETTVTYTITLSSVSGSPVSSGNLRMRRKGANNTIRILSTDALGNVYLGASTGHKITTLTTEDQTISIAVDYKNGVMTAYNDRGAEIVSYVVTLPSGDSSSYTREEWLAANTEYGWLWFGNKGTGKIAISNVSVYAGNSAVRTEGTGYTAEELQSAINSLKATNNAFTKSQFDTTTSSLTTSSSLSMPAVTTWGSAYKNYLPIVRTNGTGARLMLNDAIIADVLNISMKNPNYASALSALKAVARGQCDGILSAPYEHTSGRKGIHNYDFGVLGTIEAKAFMYRLMFEQDHAAGSVEALERDKYGYEAIIAMKNYLRTLDIQYITSDQCRDYGYVMFIAAEVYDWCYPLLTAADKEQIIFGVVESCCNGTCGDPSYHSSSAYKQKMEVGFPPSGQGSVSGHGSEAQILRDYLSFAIAIYDEDPSWYNYVGQRIVGDYAEVRKVYFASGMTQQGICTYAAHRHFFDLYSGWIMEAATGKNPYDGMENTLVSIINYALPDERVFPDGDGASKKINDYARHALISSALYSDNEASDLLFTWFAHYNGVETMALGAQGGITYPTFFAMASRGQKILSDRYEGLDPVSYNGAPLGQMIARSEWNDPDAAAVFMKIKERHTANHEHDDAGSFQIYYKALLTGDSGVYDGYGNNHHKYYHKSTVAHNGLLIADPAKLTGYYTGGQRQPSEASNLSTWSGSTYDTGKITGVQYGYKDAEKTKTDYAYLAGDITAAYESTQASYVGRRMLAVYTEDENYPMYFFVFDRITAAAANYKKTFLFHIRGMNAPTVSGNVITTTNGTGKLVLHSLTDGATIEALGGEGMNYLINGAQLASPNNKSDSNWGRVEISTSGKATSTFMNAMYVTDTSCTAAAPTVRKIAAAGVEGAQIGGAAAVFATSATREAAALSFTTTGTGNIKYYVSGVVAGNWSISVNGTSYGTATATDDGGLLTFTAPAGSVKLTREAIVFEDYSTNVVDTTVSSNKVSVNTITYSSSDYTKCKFTTVKDSSGNYLLTETTDGAALRSFDKLYEKLEGETAVSFVVKMATVSGKTPLIYSFRLRDSKSGNNYKEIFVVDTSGNVHIGGASGATVATLGTSFTTLRFAVDFAAGKMHYYSEDGKVTTISFTPPNNANSSAASTSEWLTYLTNTVFDCQAYKGNGAIKISEIGAYKGNVFN